MLGPRGGADRQTNEVRVRIEEVRPARHRRPVLGVAQIAEQRLLGDADAHPEQALVVVRTLDGE